MSDKSFTIDKSVFDIENLIEITFNDQTSIRDNFEAKFDYIKENLTNIIYIKDKVAGIVECNQFFLNGKFHSFEHFAIYISTKTDGNYYINGEHFSYYEWINHPEKVRYDRNKKLNLL